MRPIGNYWQVPRDLPVVKWQGGELLAWRVWRLCRWQPDGGLRLVSLARGTVWHGPVLTADHVPDAVADSGSGVYALKPAMRPSRHHFNWALGPDTWVRGWVALSGRVVEHERGYRAERVVIRQLRLGVAAHRLFLTPETLAAPRDELERRYQCPVKITGVDARIARGFVSPLAIPVVGHDGWLQSAPQTPPVPQRRPRVRHPKGVSPDGIAYDAVRRAFARAQRALKIDWKLYGRGHCERVTLKPHYSLHARCGASKSVAWFSPSGALGARYVFPAALVRRAASLLRVDANVLISGSW